jgi:hypothetical protein
VAADSIDGLRKSDVHRVLVESNNALLTPAIASYIKKKRPDLALEVDAVLGELSGEVLLTSVVRASDSTLNVSEIEHSTELPDGLEKQATTGPFDLWFFNRKALHAVSVLPEIPEFFDKLFADSLPRDVLKRIQDDSRKKSAWYALRFPEIHTHVEPLSERAVLSFNNTDSSSDLAPIESISSGAVNSVRDPELALRANEVGRNENGHMLMVDRRGVRYFEDSGFRVTEPVRLSLTKFGVEPSRGERRDEFKTLEELAAEAEEFIAQSNSSGELPGSTDLLASVSEETTAPALCVSSPQGYAKVLVDSNLQLEYQDQLDALFSARGIGVRNALRVSGWGGDQYARTLAKDGVSVAFKPVQVGSGANIVGGSWKLLVEDQMTESLQLKSVAVVVDVLAGDDVALAAEIEAMRGQVMARRAANSLKLPQELLLQDFAELATVTKLVNHGRKWDVAFGNLSGFCDSPTVPLALREAHSNFINNALFTHTVNAFGWMEKAIFPLDAVLAEYPELKVRFAELFVNLELTSVGVVPEKAASGPSVDHLRTRIVDTLAVQFPANWIVMNAPRPLLGTKVLEGEFLTGRFYAGIDPDDSMSEAYIHENEKLDARLVVVMSRDDQMGVVLQENAYQDKYLAIEPVKRFEMLRPSFEKIRDMPYGQLVATLKAFKGVVLEGVFSGVVVSVEHGVVVQRVDRSGASVCHDLSKLSSHVQAGNVVDVNYRDGVGLVSGLHHGSKVER